MSTVHESTTNLLADLVESDHEAVTALIGTSRAGAEWDSKLAWDNWKKR